MVRKVLCLCLLVLLLAYTNVFAGGSGNCIQPIKTTTEKYGVGVAYEYNYVSSRILDLMVMGDQDDMKVEGMSQSYGKIIYGLSDNKNIYVPIGAAHYELKFSSEHDDADMRLKLKNGIYTGIGVNALFPWAEASEKTGFDISWGYDIQANGFINDVKSLERDGRDATSLDGTLFGFDGQNSIYVTAKYDIEKIKTSLVPYIGAYQSWIVIGTLDALDYETANMKTSQEESPFAFDILSFGLLLGIDIEVADYVNLNVEGRLIGETAITTGATIKF